LGGWQLGLLRGLVGQTQSRQLRQSGQGRSCLTPNVQRAPSEHARRYGALASRGIPVRDCRVTFGPHIARYCGRFCSNLPRKGDGRPIASTLAAKGIAMGVLRACSACLGWCARQPWSV